MKFLQRYYPSTLAAAITTTGAIDATVGTFCLYYPSFIIFFGMRHIYPLYDTPDGMAMWWTLPSLIDIIIVGFVNDDDVVIIQFEKKTKLSMF